MGLGPLSGLRVVEIAGIGPGPFCAMMLADFGCDVVRVDRLEKRTTGGFYNYRYDLLNRNRRSIALNLKQPEAVDAVLRLVDGADALIEGFRPGVAERLGIGPDVCLERNPRLVYGRMTGWGQSGPYADLVGHDINYISIAGVLHVLGNADGPPVPPMNLIGDFGGGGMMLAFGIACALFHAQRTGEGQVIDAAMTDGSALLGTIVHLLRAMGTFNEERGTNLLDTGAPFYNVYETSDHRWVSVGAIEPQFYAGLLEGMELDPATLPPQMDKTYWPEIKRKFAAVFSTRTRDDWSERMQGRDACFAPVLSPEEAITHPHNRDRGTFIEIDGVAHPAPAPRLSRTPSGIPDRPPQPGEHTTSVLNEVGYGPDVITELLRSGVAVQWVEDEPA